MNLTRAAARELRTRAQRARAANDPMEARVLDSLLVVAERTASLASATNRLYRCDTSAELVAAALRVQHQAIVNLSRDEHVDAIDRGRDALAELHSRAAQMMIAIGAGTRPDEEVTDTFHLAARALTTWAMRPAGTGWQ